MKKMKNLKLITSILLLFVSTYVQAQNEPTGVMNATTTNTFNYMKDGVKLPYTVKVQESRAYNAKFKAEDMDKMDQDRVSTPTKVAKLITIIDTANPANNTVIFLKYEKLAADTFTLDSTDRGIVVNVDGKIMEYIIGKGVYFANTADKDFFSLDEFDMAN